MVRVSLVALLLAGSLLAVPARADDWTPVAEDHGVRLAYQAVGNVARLRITNNNRAAADIAWKLKVQLVTGTEVDQEANLRVDAGQTVTVASGPYRDAGHPAEVKAVHGTARANPVTYP